MKLWTGGVGGELLELRMDDCTFQCPLEKYENLTKKMLPTNDDRWCTSEECRTERRNLKHSQSGKPTLYLKDNDEKMAFAIAGYGVLSMKYGKTLLARGEH